MIPKDWVAEVGPEGAFVRWISRARADELGAMHRSVVVLIYNRQRHLLVQKRSALKNTQPLHWDTSVSGFVDYIDHPNGDPELDQDAFYSASHRELHEELGVSCDLTKIAEYPPCTGVHIEQMAVFRGFYEGPFLVDEAEVCSVDWINPKTWSSIHPKTKQLEWLYARGILWSF